MDFFEMVWRSPGWIFGPLMMLAGVVAVVMCARATLRSDRVPARRALAWALVPPVLGALGAVFGAVVWALSGPAADPARARMALVCTVAFGLFVAAVPFLWALVLLQRRPAALA
ncbi:MAG: hypothetical protein J0I06_07560 [Planctomycetes bacterium]|nr:hypothetical protein [Planctomycetota bacterium]